MPFFKKIITDIIHLRWEFIIFNVLNISFFLYCCIEFMLNSHNPKHWDFLLISGVAAFLIGLWMTKTFPDRMDETLTRLFNRRALTSIFPEALNRIQTGLNIKVKKLEKWGAVITAVIMLAAFIAAYFKQEGFESYTIALTIFQVAMGLIAGFYIGRMIGYAMLGQVLMENDVTVNITTGHIDGAGGLKPIGDFYFYQAMVASIPALFLGIWCFLLPLPLWQNRYLEWQKPYVGLLFPAIIIEVLVFIAPMITFHRMMKAEKKKKLQQADSLSVEILSLEERLANSTDPEKQNMLKEQLAGKTKQYWSIENLPTWPVAPRTKKLFKLNNIILFLPLLGKLTRNPAFWSTVSEIFKPIISALKQ